jgi:hypothetical protein
MPESRHDLADRWNAIMEEVTMRETLTISITIRLGALDSPGTPLYRTGWITGEERSHRNRARHGNRPPVALDLV